MITMCLCAMSYLSTRLQCENEDVESKLNCLFQGINEMEIILEASLIGTIQATAYFIDSSFEDIKSHIYRPIYHSGS